MTPTVSYLLFAYNHGGFVEAALRSAFDQTHEAMEIIVTDDGSSDETTDIIQRSIDGYAGSKAVRFKRNPRNLGIGRVVNAAVADARGDIVVVASGDDESLPMRTARIVQVFASDPGIQCVFSNAEVIDESGRHERLYYAAPPEEKDLRSFHDPNMGIPGATAAWRRDLFTTFGPLDETLMIEDRVIPVRAAMLGRVAYIDEALVRYRRHAANLWHGVGAANVAFDAWWAASRNRNDMMVTVLENRLRDIDTAMRMLPPRQAVAALREVTATALMRMKAQARLYRNPGLWTRLLVTGKILTSGADRRYAKHWIKKFFFSRRYFSDIRARGQLWG